MRGEKLAQVREAALQVLAGLDDGEAFNVILYNEGVEPLADRPVRKSRATMKDATEFLEAMTARGGTNIHDALLEALRQPPVEGDAADRPVHDRRAADRRADLGSRHPRAGRKGNPHQRRIFTFGVGVDVNTPLLEKIAYESRATTTFILPGEDVEVKVAVVFQRLRGPVLADPTLAVVEEPGAGETRDLIPAPDSRRLRGRPDRPARPVRRRGAAGVLAPRELPRDAARVPVPPVARPGDYAQWLRPPALGQPQDRPARGRDPRTGGYPGRRPGEAEASAGSPPRELVDEIVRLSTEFGILTEYTAFLAQRGPTSRRRTRSLRGREPFPEPSDPDPQRALLVNQDLNNQYSEEHCRA